MRKLLIAAFILFSIAAQAQNTWLPQPYQYEFKRALFDSTLRVPVMNSDRAYFTNKDSIGTMWMRTDSVKLFGRFPGNVIKSLVTYDSLVDLKNQFNLSAIRNQLSSSQTGDYYISGQGSASKLVAYRAASVPFVQYLMFSHDGIDTTKKTWAFGVSGTPAGSPFHTGDSLTLRSYSTTGTFVRDVMVFYRNGTIRIPGTNNLILGNTGAVATELTVNGQSQFNGSTQINGSYEHTGGVTEHSTTTITGDYTVLSSDLFINVNNSANCTITLPNTPVGHILYIKKIISNAFTVTIVPGGGGVTIDGGSSVVISAFNASILVHDDGTNYFVY